MAFDVKYRHSTYFARLWSFGCIGVTSALSISVLGMPIATVMTCLSEASFGYDDHERRSLIGSVALAPAPGEGVPVPPMQPPALSFLDLDFLNDKVEDP